MFRSSLDTSIKPILCPPRPGHAVRLNASLMKASALRVRASPSPWPVGSPYLARRSAAGRRTSPIRTHLGLESGRVQGWIGCLNRERPNWAREKRYERTDAEWAHDRAVIQPASAARMISLLDRSRLSMRAPRFGGNLELAHEGGNPDVPYQFKRIARGGARADVLVDTVENVHHAGLETGDFRLPLSRACDSGLDMRPASDIGPRSPKDLPEGRPPQRAGDSIFRGAAPNVLIKSRDARF